ncbi:MAG: flavodoxin family protein [Candidatus Mcinerneyibacterium aminivorans]|uniref:Flavodoxin family protein n=1 Tax=Candidatus Mcinerneyibacterium aminivorans TaxID=2703815 RepID=A0A5D0MCZ6_9BACT|nr:MAG: flavodoxin family protein [Candidatus Mcinerneyibacterium aminivorans]
MFKIEYKFNIYVEIYIYNLILDFNKGAVMNKIVAISGGRKNKISEKAIKTILSNVRSKYNFYSLSDFEILTCDACNGCVEKNKCIKDDRLNEIYANMKNCDLIIFAAPEYWDGVNAKSRAFWERICFSGRHNAYFPLKGKKGIILGVSGRGDSKHVISDLSRFMNDAQIEIMKKISIQGEFACFNCGYGENCKVGGIFELYPHNPEIKKEKIPTLTNQHPEKCDKKINKKKELIKTADYINRFFR